MLALVGLALVLDVLGGVRIDGIGVAWGLLAAVGLASYFLMSGSTHETALPPLALAGGGLVVGALAFAVLGVVGVLPMEFASAPAELNGFSLPWWVAVLELGVIAAATPYVTGITATRVLGAKLASFVGLSEVLFTVLFAWVLLGSCPGRSSWSAACSSWPASWSCAPRGPARSGSAGGTSRQRLKRTWRSVYLCSAMAR